MRFILALILILTIGVVVSLHDVDKTNSNRITPILNSADDVQQRMAQGTNGVQNTNDLEEVDGLQFRERQIVAVQDGENKAAFGFYGTANKFGLKVAEDGADVLTATDDQLLFNSEQNVFKIVKKVPISVTINSPGDIFKTSSIAHGLDFTPAYVAFITPDSDFPAAVASDNGPNPYPIVGTGTSLPFLIAYLIVTVDDTDIHFNITTGTGVSGTYTSTAIVYLLQETIN